MHLTHLHSSYRFLSTWGAVTFEKKISGVNNSNIGKRLKKKGKILLILLQDTMLDLQQRTQLSHSHLQDYIVEESLQDEQ